MKIVVNDQVHLSEFRSTDKSAIVEYLNDREIYERTLRIPFPYTDAAADEWLALVSESVKHHHISVRCRECNSASYSKIISIAAG